MENKGYQRKYYEAQSSNNWDRQKVEFELKIEELRQAKTELVGQKFAMLSPKRQVLVQNKTFEEMQALLVLKEEENAVLGTLLASEREKARNLLGESQLLKIQNLDLESKLKICEGQLKDLEKSMASYFNNMTVLKTNVSKWLGSPTNSNTKSVSGLSSPKYDSQLSMHRSEIQELKSKLSELQKSYENTLKELKTKEEKESDNLLNYLTSARNSEKPKAFEESLQGELDKKTKELLAIQEDFEITEQQYKQTISDLSKENAKHKSLILNLETQLKSESWGKRSTPHSYTNSKNFEEYENNLKILTENYKLLQDRIKIMESEKIKIIQDFKAERKFTANELAKAILSGYSNNDQQKRLIEENLCKLWLAYENIFSDMLGTMFGKEYNGLFKTMQYKIEKLQRELSQLQRRYSVENLGKSEPGTADKRISFKDDGKLKKFSNSMSQESLKQLFLRGSPSVATGKLGFDDGSNSVLVLENMVTEISESERNSKLAQNFVLTGDLISFLQCSASALEDCLG